MNRTTYRRAVEKLERVYARNRALDHCVRTVNITYDEAVALLQMIDGPGWFRQGGESSMITATTHHVKTDMGDIEFMMVPHSGGGFRVQAPGCEEFDAPNLEEAKYVLRGVFHSDDTRVEVLYPEWMERGTA